MIRHGGMRDVIISFIYIYTPCFSNEDEINYFVDIDGVHYVLGEYEAGCYAAGIHYVTIADLNEVTAVRESGLLNN